MTGKTPFSAEAWKNVDWLRQATDCFDLTIRSVNVNDRQCLLVFVGGVTGTTSIEPIVESLVFDKGNLAFFPATVTQAGSLEDALDKILQGQTLVILEGSAYAFIVDTRSYPTRGPSEPTVEKSVRGARDGFIEHIMLDLGMVRRRIRDPKLVTKAYQKGSRTKTDIFVLYISDLIHPSILHDFQNRIDHLPANAEVTSERQLCELMYGQTWNPYPHVRYTERPDIAAIHLLQGSLIILVDNCPSAVILPTTFFEQTKQIEEYTQTPAISLVMRAIRLAGVFCSIYLLPLWMVLVMQQNPTRLNLPLPEIPGRITFGVQVLIADLLIEWIRLSLIHSPLMLSSLLGIVAVFVLGDAPIAYGAYTQEILIMTAIVNIGNFVTAGYELSMANKIVRLALIVMVVIGGYRGFLIGILIHLILLLQTQVGPFPYLYPLIPFNGKEFKRLFLGNFTMDKK
ncbi:spore germination protein [Holdemania filiformis]|uniref:spore germination protein n=1 Tax=Holdemania filiformis TaxID=61171 RepID=UPI00266EF8D1|nr:spore germination protein [Holdemania filiformis]